MSTNTQSDSVRSRMFAMLAFKNTPVEQQKAIMKRPVKANEDGTTDAFLYGFDPWEQLILNDKDIVYAAEGTGHGLLVKATFPKQIGVKTHEGEDPVPLHTLDILISVEEGEPPYVKDLNPSR